MNWRGARGVGRFSAAWLMFVMLAALAAPLLPWSPDSIDMTHRLTPPEAGHLMGTDELGRDVLGRMLHGARISLLVGVVSALLSLVVGASLGAIAGYYGGIADWLISRLIEIVLCFPFIFLVLGIVALFKPSITTLIVALGLSSWTTEARFVRGELLRVRESEFAHAARAIGASHPRIIARHLLPNAIAPAIVSSTFGVATAILTESALSFLGLGVPLPTPSWGNIVSGAQEHIDYAWWLIAFPGIVIFVTAAACNILGDQLRERLDPRSASR
jgi:peptide/nickel transport system permease protein